MPPTQVFTCMATELGITVVPADRLAPLKTKVPVPLEPQMMFQVIGKDFPGALGGGVVGG